MASIRKEISIEASPELVWEAVRDVGAVHQRLAPGFVLNTRLDGDTRIVSFANGAVARELLVDLDHKARRLAYSVVESPLKMIHHHATIQVLPEGTNQSRVVWIADVWPNEAADRVGPMMEQGSLVMKRTLNSLKSEV
jgi:polyketide cyclase/dehydrase/lipid transport protein